MKQASLFQPVRREKTIKSQTRDYDKANLRCAKEIVAEPSQHGGCDSGLSQWARAVIERLEGGKAHGPLFS
jgi:hypothetical protein